MAKIRLVNTHHTPLLNSMPDLSDKILIDPKYLFIEIFQRIRLATSIRAWLFCPIRFPLIEIHFIRTCVYCKLGVKGCEL